MEKNENGTVLEVTEVKKTMPKWLKYGLIGIGVSAVAVAVKAIVGREDYDDYQEQYDDSEETTSEEEVKE